MKLFLECVFVLLPGVAARSEFTSGISIHMPLWKNMFLHEWNVLVIKQLAIVIFLNPHNINCLMI